MEQMNDNIVTMLIDAGKKEYAPFIEDDKSRNIEMVEIITWLMLTTQEMKITLTHEEIIKVSNTLYFDINKIMQKHSELTVGELRKKIHNLPDEIPVFYQRIEDSYFDNGSWKTVPFVWEQHKINPSKIKEIEDNPSPHHKVVYIDGKPFLRDYSHYIAAFSATVTKTDDGKKAFIINAHF